MSPPLLWQILSPLFIIWFISFFYRFVCFFMTLVYRFVSVVLNSGKAYVLVSSRGLSSPCPLHRYTPPFRQLAFFIGYVKLRPRLIWGVGVQLIGECSPGLSSPCPLHRYTPPFRHLVWCWARLCPRYAYNSLPIEELRHSFLYISYCV